METLRLIYHFHCISCGIISRKLPQQRGQHLLIYWSNTCQDDSKFQEVPSLFWSRIRSLQKEAKWASFKRTRQRGRGGNMHKTRQTVLCVVLMGPDRGRGLLASIKSSYRALQHKYHLLSRELSHGLCIYECSIKYESKNDQYIIYFLITQIRIV